MLLIQGTHAKKATENMLSFMQDGAGSITEFTAGLPLEFELVQFLVLDRASPQPDWTSLRSCFGPDWHQSLCGTFHKAT